MVKLDDYMRGPPQLCVDTKELASLISTMRRSKYIERFKITQQAQMTAATYNLVRMCKLLAA